MSLHRKEICQSSRDAIFYNTQGFLMQLLGENMPGLYSVDEPNKADHSDILTYSRHEFNSYVLQHAERQAHAVDGNDPNWHLDGTPHIDHDYMILAIAGVLDDGTLPIPGETPQLKLVVTTQTLFADGLAGDAYVEMQDHASTDSYKAHEWQGDGNILTNGTLIMRGETEIKGAATAFGFDLADNADVTKAETYAAEPKEFLVVDMPQNLEELGALVVSGHDSLVVSTGSYHVSEVSVSGHSELYIDNTAGPVTFYVSGPVEISGHALVTLADLDPEKFALYVMSNDDVVLSQFGEFYGVVYAPDSLVKIEGHGEFYGAFVGAEVVLSQHAQVHYDKSLLKGDKKPSDKQHERNKRDGERQHWSNEAKKAADEAEKAVEEALDIVADTQAKVGETVSDMAAKATKAAADMANPIEKLADKVTDVAEEMADKVAKVVEKADKAAAEATEAANATELDDAEKAAEDAQKAADEAADKATDAQAAAQTAANELNDKVADVDAEMADVTEEVTIRVSEAQADVAELTAKALEKVIKAQDKAAEAVVYAGKAKDAEGFAAVEIANAAVVTTQQAYDDVVALGAQAIADAQTVADQIIADAQAHADQAHVDAAAATAQANASADQAANIAAQAAASAVQAADIAANF